MWSSVVVMIIIMWYCDNCICSQFWTVLVSLLSQQNQLCDRSLVQLYLKSTNMYLAINNGGRVINTTNVGDKHSERMVTCLSWGRMETRLDHSLYSFSLSLSLPPSLSPGLPSPCTAFFELVDRGMGIVSLHSYLYPGYRLRIVNFVMEGKVCVPSIQNKNILIYCV